MSPMRVTRTDHLLVLLPFLLGYRPTDCLVLIGLRSGALGVIQRLDWPGPWGVYPAPAVDAMASVLVRDGCEEVFLVAHDDRYRRRIPALDGLRHALAVRGVAVAAALAVTGENHWLDIDCTDPGCCPVGGRPLPPVSDVPAAAMWVFRGVDPFPDRAALEASVEPAPGITAYDFSGFATRPPRRPSRALARRAWGSVLALDGLEATLDDLDPATAWRAVQAAAVPRLRDEVLAMACPDLVHSWSRRTLGPPSGSDTDSLGAGLGGVASDGAGMDGAGMDATGMDGERLLHRGTEFVRRLPEGHRADALAVVAACAWWYGHGTLARICQERAVGLDPGLSLARLVARLLDYGVRPPRSCA